MSVLSFTENEEYFHEHLLKNVQNDPPFTTVPGLALFMFHNLR
jgi:hypothetical protein